MTAERVTGEPTQHSQNAWVIQTRLAAASRYNRWIHDLMDPFVGQRLLDAGAGIGNLTQLFFDRGLVVAVEIRADFCEFLRNHFADQGNLRVMQADLATLDVAVLQELRLDTIVSANVLEHIEDDQAALRNLHEALQPGGRAVLFTPALPCLYGTMDAADDHYRRYKPQDLASKLKSVGFVVERQRWVNLPGVLAWWLNGKVLRRPFVSESNYGLFDRLVPLVAVVERVVPAPVGLSILSVARRGR